jgi:excisionase family DNA binding protein
LGKNENNLETLGDFLTVQEAASRLGVSPSTLRNWDRAGKLKARRHPINGYRLYASEELEKLLRSVKGKR